MKIRVNGTEHETAAVDVAALIAELDLPAKAILIEHNLRALHPREWPETPLKENDQVEILRVVAGG